MPTRRLVLTGSLATVLTGAAGLTAADSASAAARKPRPVDLYLLLGQSNAGGLPLWKFPDNFQYLGKPPPGALYDWGNHGNTWGRALPGKISFGVPMIHRLWSTVPAYTKGERRLALFKVNHPGTSSQKWIKTHMPSTVKQLRTAVKNLEADPTVSSVTFRDLVWAQGEDDVTRSGVDVTGYPKRFKTLLGMLRDGVPGAGDLTATIIHLNAGWPAFTKNAQRRADVKEWNELVAKMAKNSTAIDHIRLEGMKYRNDGLGVHYSAASYGWGGRQIANQLGAKLR